MSLDSLGEYSARPAAEPGLMAAALDALAEHVAVVAADGRIVAVNRGWRQFARDNGAACDAVCEGADYFAVCRAAQGEDRDIATTFLRKLEALFRGELTEFSLEYPCHSPKQQRWFMARASAFSQQARLWAVVSHANISARKLAEESLGRSEELYRTIFQASGNPLLIIDEQGLILQVNAQFEEQSGYSRGELAGLKNWREFIDPHDLERMEALSGQLWNNPAATPVKAEIRFLARGGRMRYALMTASRMADHSQAIVFLTDYTVRRAMTQALVAGQSKLSRQYEELQQVLRQVEAIKREWELTLDCVDDVVVLVDASGHVKRCNRALQTLTGKTLGELIGMPLGDLLGGFLLAADELHEQGVELSELASGRHLVARAYPFRAADGAEAGTVLTIQDTTRIQQMTGELARVNQDLEAKSRELQRAYDELATSHQRVIQQEKLASIGQLAAGVAHEINNPLGFITSNLGSFQKYWVRLREFLDIQDRLLADAGTETALLAGKRRDLKIDFILEDVASLLAESLEGAERVRKIVQDLKSFSRLDDLEPRPADVAQCLESAINIVWNEIKYKAELIRDIHPLPPLPCHPQQLSQVFVNLLVNAAQAIAERGAIRVSARHAQDSIEIAVSDTGCGIDPKNRMRLFDPFFTTKPVGEGTGLGLAIAYEIVKKHGGDIEVESAPGQGATFTVRLPLVAEAAAGLE